ncbi:TPA: fimbria/pilus periplasmic chaperone, partial [Escherichia coli]
MKFLTMCLCNSAFFLNVAEGANNRDVITRTFTVQLGATRVIYNPESSGATLTVTNQQNYPMLVQSEVLSEDQKSRAPFIITPPLFRLDAQQSSKLRIVRTGGNFPEDRETLQWICVKGIPPKNDDIWARDTSGKESSQDSISLQLQFSVNSCIKMFIRPSSLKGNPDDFANRIYWEKHGDKLKGNNPTPFYMNISELSVGNKKISHRHYIPPFSSYEFDYPKSATGQIQWRVMTDYGISGKNNQAAIKNH